MSDLRRPVFSVITVVFNDAINLRKTIASVVEQEYTDVEFIVIDGGSTDGTVEVIRTSLNVIKQWKSEKDNGIYDAMNKGLALATGQYINFLNAGDTFHHPRVLMEIARVVLQEKVEIIYGKALHKSKTDGSTQFVKGKQITSSGLFRNVPFCHQALFVSRIAFAEIGYYNTTYRVVSDYEWLIRYYQSRRSTNRMRFFDSVVVDYDTDGFSFKNIPLSVTEKIRVARENFEGWHFMIGNLYFYIDHIRVRVVLLLFNSGLIQHYRKLKYGILNGGYFGGSKGGAKL